jgi:hypothetical protein
MNEPDALDRNIKSLQQLQRVAWQQLSGRSVSALEARALRAQLRQANNELRLLLEMKSQRMRFRRQAEAPDDGGAFGTPDLRFLA